MNTSDSNPKVPVLTEQAMHAILGVPGPVALTPDTMARRLNVTFFPVADASPRVLRFGEELRRALERRGVTVLPYDQALVGDRRKKLRSNLVVMTLGKLESGNLPADYVSDLRTTTGVGIMDGPCPAEVLPTLQEKLNSVVQALTWDLVQLVIYVDDDSWTLATMNAAVIKCDMRTLDEDVFQVLVPKLAAPVIPPDVSTFDMREGTLDLTGSQYGRYVRDFEVSGSLWEQTRLMLFHTSMDSLEFRNRFYKRLAGAFLDHRTGMSYGFLARQVAVPAQPALLVGEADQIPDITELRERGVVKTDQALSVLLRVGTQELVVSVPDIWVLTTRSGCDKSHIDPERDIVLMGLQRGKIVFATPQGVNHALDCKPSYDTVTILSHAVGNALIASLQARTEPGAAFGRQMADNGMALAHWHGYVDASLFPPGYVVFGHENPPVSCSTWQSALFALEGKLEAYTRSRGGAQAFAGDVHVEPHHGTNVTGPSLEWLARWALEHIDQLL